MKLILRLSRAASRYKQYYIVGILATLLLTCVNLAAPRVLSMLTGLVERGLTESSLRTIVYLTLTLIALYLFRVLFRFLSNYMVHKAAWELVGDLRIATFDKLQRLSLSFFHDKQSGDLVSRVVNDTREFELLYAHIIPEMITNLVTFAGVLVILLTVNARLALITCAPIPLILFSGIVFGKKVRPYFRASQQKQGEFSGKLQDDLSGVHEIQSFCQEDLERVKVDEKNRSHVRAMLKALKISAVFHPSVELFSSLGTVLVVGFGGVMAMKNALSVEDIVSFVLYLSLFYQPVASLANLMENVQQALAGAERVLMILDSDEAVKDDENAVEARDIQGEVSFENVSFAYEDGVDVLKDISFTARPGMTVALVGPTGVGKTTLTQLISRFYEPTAGRVLLDGKPLCAYTVSSLREQIAPVLQDTFLFNGTIAENIAYASKNATRSQIEQAARDADIHDDIMLMPKGYDTQVGERGVRLSGGQKQRIAIARAILRRSPVIVLDEATSAVDVETEQKIQQAISNLSGKHTVFAIAHRLSTIRHADLILVLRDGRIVESGTHEELLSKNGVYARTLSIIPE